MSSFTVIYGHSNRSIKIRYFHLSLENSLSGIIAGQNIMPVLIHNWILHDKRVIKVNYFKPTFFFRQSFFVSSRFCFPQFPFSVLFLSGAYVVFRTLLPFVFFRLYLKRLVDLTQVLLSSCLGKSLSCKILITFFHQSHFP